MKKIIGCFNISSNDAANFYNTLKDDISALQNDNQEVEIQYNTQIINGDANPVVYSALIVGRKEI